MKKTKVTKFRLMRKVFAGECRGLLFIDTVIASLRGI
jgi:hypothetical protein